MPSTIINTSFLGCYSLSKIYIGKDVYIKKIDLSTTNINHLTTPEKYNPLTENNVIAIESKELVKLPKTEEKEKEQIKELKNSINDLNNNVFNLNQELTKKELDKQELIKKTGELQDQINVLTGQLDNTLKASDLVYNLLGQLSSKKNLLERTSEVIQKFVDLNNSLTELQSADKKVKVQEGVIDNLKKQVSDKDKELTQKNNQITSLNSKVSSLQVDANTITTLQQTIKNKESEISGKNSQIASLNSQVSSLNVQVKETNSLKSQISSLNSQIRDLEQKYKTQKSENDSKARRINNAKNYITNTHPNPLNSYTLTQILDNIYS